MNYKPDSPEANFLFLWMEFVMTTMKNMGDSDGRGCKRSNNKNVKFGKQLKPVYKCRLPLVR